MSSNPDRACIVCGFDGWHEGRAWLFLAAWAVGGTNGYEAKYTPDEDDDTRSDWECIDDEVSASGSCACWPDCAYQFIEAAMVSCEFANREDPTP